MTAHAHSDYVAIETRQFEGKIQAQAFLWKNQYDDGLGWY